MRGQPKTGARRCGRPRTYRIWLEMRRRCNGKKHSEYFRYGARGIKVCPEWGSFDVFLSDMGQCPSTGHSIDRINNEKGYEKSNCRWATASQQAANRRRRGTESSEFRGVSKHGLGFRVHLRCQGKDFRFPVIKDEIAAAIIYDLAAIQVHGDFASLNFPEMTRIVRNEKTGDAVDVVVGPPGPFRASNRRRSGE